MLIFILFSLLFTILALLLILPAFLRKKSPHTLHTDNTRINNIIAGRERMQALRERADAGEISIEEMEEHTQEIENHLLSEVGEITTENKNIYTAKPSDWLSATIIIVILLIFPPVLYTIIGVPTSLSPIISEENTTLLSGDKQDPQNLIELEKRLKKRLETTPNDTAALYWLGRIMSAQGKHFIAAEYFSQARDIAGDSPDLYVAEINALILDNTNQQHHQRINHLLTQGLEITPENSMLLWLAGLHAENNGNFKMALSYWEKAHANLSDTPENQEQIMTVINDLKQRMADEITPDNTVTKQDGVIVVIEKDTALKNDDKKILFVFAKANDVNTPPMPLAVHRQARPIFPLTVRLDDSKAMTPTTKMSQFNTYHIVARLSKTGNATASSGDFYGEIINVLPNSTLTVFINRIVP